MTEEQVRALIVEIIEYVAPDEDLGSLDDEEPLRDQLGLDSMDFVDIVLELRKRHKIEIPEEDYVELTTMKSIVSYLMPKMGDR